jgi:hypothetical protein
MPAQVTIIKEFEYRGAAEEWSNTYAVTGAAFADYAAMLAFCEALASEERKVYLQPCKAIRALVYQPGSIVADRTIDFQLESGSPFFGQLVVGSSAQEWAGDQAGWIRGKIGVNSKGRAVYVRKYFHAGASEGGASTDATIGQWRAAADALLVKLTDGSLPGGRKWCGPNSEAVTLMASSLWTTTRTLKRRGKRPTVAP